MDSTRYYGSQENVLKNKNILKIGKVRFLSSSLLIHGQYACQAKIYFKIY